MVAQIEYFPYLDSCFVPCVCSIFFRFCFLDVKMSITVSTESDGIEVLEKGIEDKTTETKSMKSAIEEEDDLDDSQQVCALFTALSTRNKRRTMDMIADINPDFLSSTLIGELSETAASTKAYPKTKEMKKPDPEYNKSSSLTMDGEVTLIAGESRIVIQSSGSGGTHRKLGRFSGITPVPSGQVNFKTWKRATARMIKCTKSVEGIQAIQNSLMQPALDLVQTELDSGDPECVLRFLDQIYGVAIDRHSVLKEFYDAVQDLKVKETPSSFLNRLYLLMEECKEVGAIKHEDAMETLLKQFISGCLDETLLTKLRFEDRESDPPSFGDLLMTVRKEEAKRTKKQMLAKLIKTQQIQAVNSEDNLEMVALRQQVGQLKQQIAKSQDVRLRETAGSTDVEILKQQVMMLRQELHRDTLTKQDSKVQEARKSDQNRGEQQQSRTMRRKFCFKCGNYDHMVWTCTNRSDPDLVTKRFEENRATRNKVENR